MSQLLTLGYYLWYLGAMESEEFDTILTQLGIGSKQAADEMRDLGGGKTSTSYVSAMRGGRKNVSQAAAIYTRMRQRSHNQGDRNLTQEEVINWIKRNTPSQ